MNFNKHQLNNYLKCVYIFWDTHFLLHACTSLINYFVLNIVIFIVIMPLYLFICFLHIELLSSVVFNFAL